MRAYFLTISEYSLGIRYLIVTELCPETDEYRSSLVDSDYATYYVSAFYTDPANAICECVEWAFSDDSNLIASHLYAPKNITY